MNIKSFILSVPFFIPLILNGQLNFSDGMEWRTLVYGTHVPDAVSSVEVVTVEKAEDDDCFNMYRYIQDKTSERELIAAVKTEGSKVLFMHKQSTSPDWYLMYDFGLNPGEGCFIYTPLGYSEDLIPHKSYVYCTGIGMNHEGEEWPELLLEEYMDDSRSLYLGNGSWLTDLASINGFLHNIDFGNDGGASYLIEVSVDGEIIYSNNRTGVSEISKHPTPFVKVIGDAVYISAENEVHGSVYSLSGDHIGDYKFGDTPICIPLPNKGIYILKMENVSMKFIVTP